MLSRFALNKIKLQQGFGVINKVMMKKEYPIFQINIRNLRKFSSNPFSIDKDEEVLKIETHPHLYVDILTNKYQQKVMAKKLMIPDDFVHKYFKYFNKFKTVSDSTPSMTHAFDPKNFAKDTPVSVVKEYLKIIEDGLKQAYLEHGDKQEITNLFLKPFDASAYAQKYYKDMPQFLGYEKTEYNEREITEIEYEKDVFQTKLNANEEALIDRIVNNIITNDSTLNPLTENETYKTPKQPNEGEFEASSYALADMALRDKSSALIQDIAIANIIKRDGLLKLKRQQDPLFIEQSKAEMQESNFLNNSLAEKIMIKRKILQNKLQMIEQMNKVYQNKASLEFLNNSINSRNSINFIETFETNRKAQNIEIKRYKGKDKNMQRMDSIILMLKNGDKDEALIKEYEELSNQIRHKFSSNLNYHLMNVEFGIESNNSAMSIKSFEDLVQTASIVDQNGDVKSFVPADAQLLKQLFEL